MKQNILEHIIRTIITEQIHNVKSGKKWKVRTVFKRDLGSASDDMAAQAAGAVYGFRIKALSKNATEEQIATAIIDTINNDTQLQKYLNSNYIFIQSSEQRDSDKNRLYNYWILPKDYALDKLWVYNNKVKRGQEGSYNMAIGLPSRLEDAVKGTLKSLKGNTPHKTVTGIINSVNLRPIKNPIDYPYIDIKRYESAYNWLLQLKNINKKVKTADLKTPEEYSKEISKQTVYTFTTEDPLPIELTKKSIFSSGFKDPVVFFAGNYDVKNSVPMQGQISTTNDWSNGPVYTGTFTATSEFVKVSPVLKNNDDTNNTNALTDVTTSIRAVDLKDGKAENFPVKLKNFIDDNIADLIRYRYSGPVQNGQMASVSYGTEGQLENTETKIFYRGTFKENSVWDGIVWKAEGTTPNFLYRFISGQRVPYQAYVGAIYPVSENIHILAVKSEMRELFTQFLKEFKSEEFPDPKDFDLINKFIQSPVTDNWDSEMSKLVQCLNGMLYVYFQVPGFTEKDADVDNKITEPVRKWISKYHQDIPTPKR